MRISNVRVPLLSAPIPPERRWTSDFGTNMKQDVATRFQPHSIGEYIAFSDG
jgi:hypothetical protein